MARVWFVLRQGGRWVAPEGQPAREMPLSTLVFPLDLGPQRRLVDEQPELGGAAKTAAVTKVIIEVTPEDLAGEFTWFEVGFYDSPYSPAEAMRRLGALRPESRVLPAAGPST